MNIIFFSTDIDTINEWKKRDTIHKLFECYDKESLFETLFKLKDSIVIADFDTLNSEVNQFIASNTLIKNMIILEKIPEIITGKMLLRHGIKAYGNSRMLNIHYIQMIQTVSEGKIWTYPELTASLAKSKNSNQLSNESNKLIEHRLTAKEKEVLLCILDGLTNNAIAIKLVITVRTVKAHISSIFSKLHVNDRIGLVLLLK